MDDAKAGKMPARHGAGAQDMGGGALMGHGERSEYRNLVSHFENEHNKAHNADEARKDRTARYKR